MTESKPVLDPVELDQMVERLGDQAAILLTEYDEGKAAHRTTVLAYLPNATRERILGNLPAVLQDANMSFTEYLDAIEAQIREAILKRLAP